MAIAVATDCGAICAACFRYALQAASSLGTSDITPNADRQPTKVKRRRAATGPAPSRTGPTVRGTDSRHLCYHRAARAAVTWGAEE